MLKRIAVFYLLTFISTILLAGLQQAAGIPTTFILPQWGPGLAALLMLVLFRKDGLSLRPNLRAAGWARPVVGLAVPLLVAVALLPVVTRLLGTTGAADLTPMWVAGMAFGALGEEVGWRGYLQPLLRRRWGPFGVSLLVGLLWALWHMQMWANGPVFMLFLALSMIGYSLVITALIDDAPGGRVLIATLFHLGINLGNVLFFDHLTATGFMALNAAAWLAAAAVAVILRRRLFFARKETTNDERRTTSGEPPATDTAPDLAIRNS